MNFHIASSKHMDLRLVDYVRVQWVNSTSSFLCQSWSSMRPQGRFFPQHSVFSGKPELVQKSQRSLWPSGQRIAEAAFGIHSINIPVQQVGAFSHLQTSSHLLPFCPEEDANDTFTHFLVIPRWVFKPLNCAGHVLFKPSWQTRGSSTECWGSASPGELCSPQGCALPGSTTSTELLGFIASLLQGKSWADTGTASSTLAHPLGSQPLLTGAISPTPRTCFSLGPFGFGQKLESD